MRPTHQHLCPYASPSLWAQWKDKLYEGQPPHLCTRTHPPPSTQLYFSSNPLMSLSHHYIYSSWWSFPRREQTCQLYTSVPSIQTHKPLLAWLLPPVVILFLSFTAKLFKGAVLIHCPKTLVPFSLNLIKIGFASHHSMKTVLVKFLLVAELCVQFSDLDFLELSAALVRADDFPRWNFYSQYLLVFSFLEGCLFLVSFLIIPHCLNMLVSESSGLQFFELFSSLTVHTLWWSHSVCGFKHYLYIENYIESRPLLWTPYLYFQSLLAIPT